MPVRRLAHVGQEVFKLLPPLADLDAAPAVFAIMNVFRIAAPLQHPAPNFISATVRHSVRSHFFSFLFESKLAARFSAASPLQKTHRCGASFLRLSFRSNLRSPCHVRATRQEMPRSLQ